MIVIIQKEGQGWWWGGIVYAYAYFDGHAYAYDAYCASVYIAIDIFKNGVLDILKNYVGIIEFNSKTIRVL